MDELQLLIDLHKHANRQGPGGDAETERALDLAGLSRAAPLKVADIGCGTGASALTLARMLNAEITAVDFLQAFLDELETRARRCVGCLGTYLDHWHAPGGTSAALG